MGLVGCGNVWFVWGGGVGGRTRECINSCTSCTDLLRRARFSTFMRIMSALVEGPTVPALDAKKMTVA